MQGQDRRRKVNLGKTMLSILVIILAGLAAGALNAVAGGGTFLTFPALVWFGIPPVAANATATLTALPGYIASTWAFRHDMRAEGVLSLRQIILCSAVGGFGGAALLLVTPGKAFVAIVPWLLLLATVVFALGPWLLAVMKGRGKGDAGVLTSMIAILVVSFYGGYFNGGLGILLLAVLGLIGFTDLHGMNGLKNLLSAVLSIVAVVTYAAAGLIVWKAALLMGIATTVGGYLGAHYARKVTHMGMLRAGITGIGLIMTVAFFLK